MWTRARPADAPTILLAEKDDSLCQVLSKLLAEEGYRVLGAGTRQAVLEQLRNAPRIDLVIADRGLRGMPAWDVVQETTWRRPGVPCVRLIESRADALPIYGVDPAAEAILQTPVTIIELLAVIKKLLARAATEAPRPRGGPPPRATGPSRRNPFPPSAAPPASRR